MFLVDLSQKCLHYPDCQNELQQGKICYEIKLDEMEHAILLNKAVDDVKNLIMAHPKLNISVLQTLHQVHLSEPCVHVEEEFFRIIFRHGAQPKQQLAKIIVQNVVISPSTVTESSTTTVESKSVKSPVPAPNNITSGEKAQSSSIDSCIIHNNDNDNNSKASTSTLNETVLPESTTSRSQYEKDKSVPYKKDTAATVQPENPTTGRRDDSEKDKSVPPKKDTTAAPQPEKSTTERLSPVLKPNTGASITTAEKPSSSNNFPTPDTCVKDSGKWKPLEAVPASEFPPRKNFHPLVDWEKTKLLYNNNPKGDPTPNVKLSNPAISSAVLDSATITFTGSSSSRRSEMPSTRSPRFQNLINVPVLKSSVSCLKFVKIPSLKSSNNKRKRSSPKDDNCAADRVTRDRKSSDSSQRECYNENDSVVSLDSSISSTSDGSESPDIMILNVKGKIANIDNNDVIGPSDRNAPVASTNGVSSKQNAPEPEIITLDDDDEDVVPVPTAVGAEEDVLKITLLSSEFTLLSPETSVGGIIEQLSKIFCVTIFVNKDPCEVIISSGTKECRDLTKKSIIQLLGCKAGNFKFVLPKSPMNKTSRFSTTSQQDTGSGNIGTPQKNSNKSQKPKASPGTPVVDKNKNSPRNSKVTSPIASSSSSSSKNQRPSNSGPGYNTNDGGSGNSTRKRNMAPSEKGKNSSPPSKRGRPDGNNWASRDFPRGRGRGTAHNGQGRGSHGASNFMGRGGRGAAETNRGGGRIRYFNQQDNNHQFNHPGMSGGMPHSHGMRYNNNNYDFASDLPLDQGGWNYPRNFFDSSWGNGYSGNCYPSPMPHSYQNYSPGVFGMYPPQGYYNNENNGGNRPY